MRQVWALGCFVAALAFSGPTAAQDFYTLKGHGGPVKGVAAGPDGMVVTGSFDNSVGVWTAGQPRWLEQHAAAVNAVAMLRDGRVVSAGDDFAVLLWQDGVARTLGLHQGKVIRLALSPDQTRVASASWDGTAQIHDLAGGAAVVLAGHGSNVNDVVFMPDGKRVLTASSDGTIRMWDAVTGRFDRQVVHHGFGVNTLVVDPAGHWAAYGALDGGTRVVDLDTLEVLADVTLDRRPILAMALSPDGQRLAVGDAEGYIMMLDVATWRIASDFRAALSGPIWALAFADDGRNLLAGGLDPAVYAWPVDRLGEAEPMPKATRSFQIAPAEMSNGERQFQRKCSICHTLGADQERRAGPPLRGLFGRKSGAVPGYPYSATLQNAQIVWDDVTIDALFDQGPDHYIPGSKMPMQRITAPQDRADLVSFLRDATR